MHLGAGVFVDQGPDLRGRVGAARNRVLTHPLEEQRGERRRHRFVNEDAVRRGTRLSPVAHFGQHGPLHGQGQIGIVEDEQRGVSAELHGDPKHLLRGIRDESSADLGRPGEGELSQPSVLDQGPGDGPGLLGLDDVQHPRGKPRLGEYLGK